jgi:hypothetical protein
MQGQPFPSPGILRGGSMTKLNQLIARLRAALKR